MSNQRSSRRSHVCAALALMTAGCSDFPVDPRSHDPILPPPRSYAAPTGSIITLYDPDDRVTYTLNTGTHEITRSSDGAILELDAEQTAVAATAFSGNKVADAVLNDFTVVCNPANPCAAAMNASADESAVSSGFIATKESEDSRAHPGAWFAPSPAGNSSLNRFQSSPASIDLMSGMCENIVNSVFQHRLLYASSRSTFVRDGFLYGVITARSLVLRKSLPAGTAAAVSFLASAVEGQERRVAISILGWMWNSYSCSSQQVTAGPVIRSYSGTSEGGSLNLECHYETWSISFDGGKTSSRITLNVCEYKTM